MNDYGLLILGCVGLGFIFIGLGLLFASMKDKP